MSKNMGNVALRNSEKERGKKNKTIQGNCELYVSTWSLETNKEHIDSTRTLLNILFRAHLIEMDQVTQSKQAIPPVTFNICLSLM